MEIGLEAASSQREGVDMQVMPDPGVRLALAREQSDPYALVGALNQAAIFHAQRREGEKCLQLADEVLRLSTENGFQQFCGFAMLDRGWALIELNRAEEGLSRTIKDVRVINN